MPKYNSYKETIHPQKVCKGIMDIREQLKVRLVVVVVVLLLLYAD